MMYTQIMFVDPCRFANEATTRSKVRVCAEVGEAITVARHMLLNTQRDMAEELCFQTEE